MGEKLGEDIETLRKECIQCLNSEEMFDIAYLEQECANTCILTILKNPEISNEILRRVDEKISEIHKFESGSEGYGDYLEQVAECLEVLKDVVHKLSCM